MKRPVRSRLWGCRLRFCVGSWAQRIWRLHRWKTAPLSTGKERADDPAPAPTVLTRCDCSWRATPDGDPRRPLHRSRPSLRCPGSNGTSHSTPGPRCQRRQLRPHNQRHPDLTIRLLSRKPPRSCAPTFSRAPRLSRQTPGANAPGFVVSPLPADHLLHQLLQSIGHGTEAAEPVAPDGPATIRFLALL